MIKRLLYFGNHQHFGLGVLGKHRALVSSYKTVADLTDMWQRIRAAAQFDKLLNSHQRHQIEQALEDVAEGRGVR